MISTSHLTPVEVLVEGVWVSAHVRLQAGTAARPMTVVNLLEPRAGELFEVVSSDRLRHCVGAA